MAFPDYFTEPQQPLGTVYVVDDDEAVCDSVRWLLEAGNYKVEIFDSGESFIAKYDPQAIAVLLLDVRMSGMSGLEVQEHLIARKADLPIIILTAYGDVQMAVNALKKGAVDFIEKPFDHAALRQLVEKMLGEARRRRSLNERGAAGRQKLAKHHVSRAAEQREPSDQGIRNAAAQCAKALATKRSGHQQPGQNAMQQGAAQ